MSSRRPRENKNARRKIPRLRLGMTVFVISNEVRDLSPATFSKETISMKRPFRISHRGGRGQDFDRSVSLR